MVANPRNLLRRAVPPGRRAAAATALLLLLVAAGAVARGHGRGGDAGGGSPFALYISSGSIPQHFASVDPSTLQDRPDIAGINPDVNGAWSLSADGSTLAVLDTFSPVCNGAVGNGRAIKIRDTRTGRLRACLQAPEIISCIWLSADGSRLIAGAGTGPEPQKWYVFDTTRGRPLTTQKAHETASGGWYSTLIDAQARRLYWLVPSTPTGAAGPRPLQIFAYDLTTGAEAGHLNLPDVLAGTWQTGQEPSGAQLMAQLIPGVALSPDGRQLAIVQANSDAVTLVDTARLTAERTLTLTRPASLADRLLHLLPFAPSAADAKGLAGPALQAVYAPDGRDLYVFGCTGSVDASGSAQFDGLGLKLINLTSGSVVKRGLTGAALFALMPAPDGRSLYVTGSVTVDGSSFAPGPSYLLARLEASSLAVKATRSFPSERTILLMPGRGK